LGWGGNGEGDGNGEISLRATWDQGGRDPITPRRVSKKVKGNGREVKKESARGSKNKGIVPCYVVNLYICHNNCLNVECS
jgi:hypothetical protein